MLVKQVGRIILGAELTPKESKALEIEVMKVMADLNRKNADEIDAILLWWLHEKLGFGYERLKQFHHDFAPQLKELCDRYEMHEEDERIWLCTKKLKDYDPRIDIATWNKAILSEQRK